MKLNATGNNCGLEVLTKKISVGIVNIHKHTYKTFSLENFVSINGALHYNLKLNKDKIKLTKTSKNLVFKKFLQINDEKIKIFEPGFPIFWKAHI